MRLPTLYLKWHAFQALTDTDLSDKSIGIKLFRVPEGNQYFSKLIKGDLGLKADIGRELIAEMNAQFTSQRGVSGSAATSTTAPLMPSDLELSTFAFAARMLDQWPEASTEARNRMHKVLVQDLTIPHIPEDAQRLIVDRFDSTRSFDGAEPSGGAGPIVFEAGRHKGQIAVLGESRVPLAAFTMFTRDPAPIGKHIWDLAWGEAILWFPAPSVPVVSDGRLLLMAKPEPVKPQAGRFVVTTALVWTPQALDFIDPKSKSPRPDETETILFLTRLRRVTEDKHKKWEGAVTVLSAEYLVKA